jgi:hypothetical protein
MSVMRKRKSNSNHLFPLTILIILDYLLYFFITRHKGAALAVAYSKRLRDIHLKDVDGPIVLEVCGGSGVDLDLLQNWKTEYLPSK